MKNNLEAIRAAGSQPEIQRNLERKEGDRDIDERMEEKLAIFQKQYENMDKNEPIILKAQELLRKYHTANYVPESELDIDNSGFDDARLKAFIQIIEEKK